MEEVCFEKRQLKRFHNLACFIILICEELNCAPVRRQGKFKQLSFSLEVSCTTHTTYQCLLYFRACKVCLRNKFGSNHSITCPLPHEPGEDESLEECQRDGGLKMDDITPDPAVQRVLLKQQCHCKNREYGCKETPTWRKLPVSELANGTCADLSTIAR